MSAVAIKNAGSHNIIKPATAIPVRICHYPIDFKKIVITDREKQYKIRTCAYFALAIFSFPIRSSIT